MKIIQKGDLSRINKDVRFDCEECLCIFECDDREYSRKYGFNNVKTYTAACPTCGRWAYVEEVPEEED